MPCMESNCACMDTVVDKARMHRSELHKSEVEGENGLSCHDSPVDSFLYIGHTYSIMLRDPNSLFGSTQTALCHLQLLPLNKIYLLPTEHTLSSRPSDTAAAGCGTLTRVTHTSERRASITLPIHLSSPSSHGKLDAAVFSSSCPTKLANVSCPEHQVYSLKHKPRSME